MEKPKQSRTVVEKVKRALGYVAGDINPETGRTRSEERMIDRMTKKGGRGFRILRSAETNMKSYSRPEEN